MWRIGVNSFLYKSLEGARVGFFPLGYWAILKLGTDRGRDRDKDSMSKKRNSHPAPGDDRGDFTISPVHEVEDIPDRSMKQAGVEYIIEDLMPAGQVHLIGGPSGSGKTTLTFQLYEALSKDPPGPFLGRQTRPVKWAYVSGDRAEKSVQETMARVGVEFPVFSLVDRDLVGADLTSKVFPQLSSLYGYRPDFIYIDGFTGLVPGGHINNYSVVAKWLAMLARYCENKKVTILGACHTTKVKEGEMFKDPRQRITGSVAWAAYTEGVIILDTVEGDDNANRRVVTLLPRNNPTEIIPMTFDAEGKLQMPESVRVRGESTAFILNGIIENVKDDGGYVTFMRLKKMAENNKISNRSLERWLAGKVKEGILVREGRGMYRVEEGVVR